MRLWIHLLAILLLFAACEKKPAPVDQDPQAAEGRQPPGKTGLELPKTGIERIQRDHADAIARLDAEEQKEAADPRAVRQVVELLDKLEIALGIAVKQEARNSLSHAQGLDRIRLAGFIKRRDALLREKQEIKQILSDAAKGVSPIPSGFTEAELKDDISDLTEAMRQLEKERAELVERMEQRHKLLTSGEPIPPREDSMAALELRNLAATRKRAEALLSR